jgi:hypothetical protein
MPHPSAVRTLPHALLLLAGLLLLPFLPARGEAGDPLGLNQGPMIRLTERKYDFGRIPQQTKVEHKFSLRNDGTAPLRILKITSDCGCTVGTVPDSLVPPGQSTFVDVTLDSENNEGDVIKVLILYTNDPAEPRIDLGLLADVEPFVHADDQQLNFGQVRRGDTPTVSTRLVCDNAPQFRATGFHGGENHVNWKIEKLPDDHGVVYRISATLRPDPPLGAFTDRIEALVDHPHITFVRLFLHGVVYSYFRLSEEKLVFDPLRTGRTLTRTIRVDGDGSKPFKITEAVPSASILQSELEPDGNGYILHVTLHAPSQANLIKETIVLKTTDPGEPEIRVPVRATIVEDPGAR